MQQFISVVKFLFGVCMSLLIMAAGVHFTYMYYMTNGPVHDVFAVVGPLFIAFAFCTAFLVIYELTQELRSEARVRAWVEDVPVVEDGPINFPTPRSFNMAADYVINSALEEYQGSARAYYKESQDLFYAGCEERLRKFEEKK